MSGAPEAGLPSFCSRATPANDMGKRSATGSVITLHGSLGGVGRTVIAVNLAAALAQSGHKVALVDLDIRFGDISILLDIPVKRSIADLRVGDGKLTADALQRCLHTCGMGVTVLPAPVRPTEWLSVGSAHVEQAVALLAQTHEYVILDSPKNYKILSAALEPADSLILVTTLDESSAEFTRQDLRMLGWLYFPRDRIRLVVNATNERTDMKPHDIERLLAREAFWTVPYDRNISTATQLGTPLVLSHPTSEAARSIVGLARNLDIRRTSPIVDSSASPKAGSSPDREPASSLPPERGA